METPSDLSYTVSSLYSDWGKLFHSSPKHPCLDHDDQEHQWSIEIKLVNMEGAFYVAF